MQLEEQKQLLNEARAEIQGLRRSNEILTAKVEVMDAFMCVLHTRPAEQTRGATPDVAWELTKRITEIEEEIRRRPTAV